MHNISNKLRKEIKSLAVAYEAYSEAFQSGNDNGLIVWGESLLRRQAEFGLELVAPITTRTLVDQAIKRSREAGLVQKSASEVLADFVREQSNYV